MKNKQLTAIEKEKWKCPVCFKEFNDDSEEMYWHIKIQNARSEEYLINQQIARLEK